VNARSSTKRATISPISGATTSGDSVVLNADAFRRMIALERKRSERSRKPFMLLLVDMGKHLSSEKNGKTLERILAMLALSSRETDITGWYANANVLGVLFTEIAADSSSIPATIITRVTETLCKNLTSEQFAELSLTFHVFPEDWDHEGEQRPSNPKLYPDLSQRESATKTLRVVKRIMDVTVSLFALVFLAPLFLMIAAAIKATSKGPIFFRQRRIGQHGKSFVFLKFRSMQVNNEAAIHKQYVQKLIAGKADKQPSKGNGEGFYKLSKDPRVTRVGAFLRKTSMDELPQFMNVLKGEMSLVGPRPPIPYEVEAYDVWHHQRLLEKPGITGLWQVSGRSRVTFDEMVRLDLRYARSWSPWEDIKILLRTPRAVVIGDGAQ
jgi:exopolysaccharide biosynthesis polyprenyl glycosylphosphotransferase